MTMSDVQAIRAKLNRFEGVHSVEQVQGRPDEVAVHVERHALRNVKPVLRRMDYEYKRGGDHRYRDEPGDWHVFKKKTDRRGPPRNSRELTRSIQKGEFDMFGR